MLVLTRRHGEGLVLRMNGETVTIKVLGIQGQRARIGIDAAASVSIVRDELLAEERASAQATDPPVPLAEPTQLIDRPRQSAVCCG